MNPTDLDAKLVRDGIGLPPLWVGASGRGYATNYHEGDLEDLDPYDPQTAFGLAVKLDEWDGTAGHSNDTMRYLAGLYGTAGWAEAIGVVLARVEWIGMDHFIRRHLGWELKPGTMMQVSLDVDEEGLHPVWCLEYQAENYVIAEHFSTGMELTRQVEGLAGITDPTEALTLIYESLMNLDDPTYSSIRKFPGVPLTGLALAAATAAIEAGIPVAHINHEETDQLAYQCTKCDLYTDDYGGDPSSGGLGSLCCNALCRLVDLTP
jgi:hypothetical protein